MSSAAVHILTDHAYQEYLVGGLVRLKENMYHKFGQDTMSQEESPVQILMFFIVNPQRESIVLQVM